jgi:hypothetical protein
MEKARSLPLAKSDSFSASGFSFQEASAMSDPDEPKVGIIFYVEDELVILSVPVSSGEHDGDFINYPRGHSDCWEALGAGRQRSIVHKNSDKSYDYFPRGRCIYSSKEDRYCLYVDKCLLEQPDVIDEIKALLRLPAEKSDVKLDPHYRCAVCNPHYVPDDVGL